MIKIENQQNGKNNSRVCTIQVNSKKFLTPFYFPSITSAETRSDITDLIRFIVDVGYPSILVSCFDVQQLMKSNVLEVMKINEFYKNGGIVLLDSGEFENFHFDGNWSFEQYELIVKKMESDFFTSFDKSTIGMEQPEINNFSEEYIPKSQKISTTKSCIAICHGEDSSKINDSVKNILGKIKNLQIIAITERGCGDTLIEQCETIKKIRQTIDSHNKEIILHVLGCGNPISISALSYAGADTFDAVDWCRWSINPKTFEYDNITVVKLFDCTCLACGQDSVKNERFRARRHNLEFYIFFLNRLRTAILQGKSLREFLENENIDQSVILNLAKLF